MYEVCVEYYKTCTWEPPTWLPVSALAVAIVVSVTVGILCARLGANEPMLQFCSRMVDFGSLCVLLLDGVYRLTYTGFPNWHHHVFFGASILVTTCVVRFLDRQTVDMPLGPSWVKSGVLVSLSVLLYATEDKFFASEDPLVNFFSAALLVCAVLLALSPVWRTSALRGEVLELSTLTSSRFWRAYVSLGTFLVPLRPSACSGTVTQPVPSSSQVRLVFRLQGSEPCAEGPLRGLFRFLGRCSLLLGLFPELSCGGGRRLLRS